MAFFGFRRAPINKTPKAWDELRDRLSSSLEAEDQILAVLELDLDNDLQFRPGLLALSSKRLFHLQGGLESGFEVQSWVLTEELSLRCLDRRDTDILELLKGDKLLGQWHYTVARRSAAHHLCRAAARRRQAGAGEEDSPGEDLAGLCSGCGTALGPDQILCPQCEATQSRESMKSLLRVLRFGRKRIWPVSLGLSLQILGTAAALIPPYLTIPMIDEVLIPWQSGANVDFNLVWYYLAGLFGAQVLSWLLTWGRTWVLAWSSERIAVDLRNTTYAHLQNLSVEYFGGRRTGDLISRISSDTDRICYFLSVHLLDFISDILNILMTAAILFWIDPVLAAVTLLPLPFVAWLVHAVRSRLVDGFTQGSIAWAELTNVLADTIPGIRVVKAFAQEKREIERFKRVNEHVLQANDKVNLLWSFFSSIVVFLTGLGVLFVWGFGAWMVLRAHVKVGVLTGFVQYISRFYGRMDSMSRMVSSFQRAGVAAQRVFSILDRLPAVPEPANPVQPGKLKGSIEFRGVSFHYDRQPVLRDLSFEIKPGEMIGLIGPSGTGKTTLINLLCRFYDVKEGAILVDGTDIRSFPVADFRRNIGIVLQEPFLFYGSIADNIAYGRPEASRAEIIAAARAARAHDFILRLPDAYDSIVGERGQSLSGGERQRISIARALLIDPRILILDEATSSVDNETEREIQLALSNLIRGRTTVAIAHRLHTLKRASRLFEIQHGRLARISTPDQVLPEAPIVPETPSRPEAQAASLYSDAQGRLFVRAGSGQELAVEPVRAFPFTAPELYISLVAARREVCCIENPESLTAEQRQQLEQAVIAREFVPRVLRIVSVDDRSIPARWQVLTDRGETCVFIDKEDDIRRLSDDRVLLLDTGGTRFLIPRVSELDAPSRRFLSIYC